MQRSRFQSQLLAVNKRAGRRLRKPCAFAMCLYQSRCRQHTVQRIASVRMEVGRTLMPGTVKRSAARRGTSGGVASCHVHSSHPIVASIAGGQVGGMDGGGGGGGSAGGGAGSISSGSTAGRASQPQARGCRMARSGTRRQTCAGQRHVCLAMRRREIPWVPPECACMTDMRWQPAGRCRKRRLRQQRRRPRPRRRLRNTCTSSNAHWTHAYILHSSVHINRDAHSCGRDLLRAHDQR